MNRDTVIGIVGAVILVAAMVGVFQYERTTGAAKLGTTGSTDAVLASLAGPTAKGSTAYGAKTDSTLKVAQGNFTNLTTATFTLTWTAGVGSDVVGFTVTPPAGAGASATKTDGSGKIELKVPVPSTAGAAAFGDWKVTVEFKSVDLGAPVPLPQNPPVGTDQSVSWNVASNLAGYAPK